MLSTKHFELAPEVHFLPLVLFKLEVTITLELPYIALFICKYPNNGINVLFQNDLHPQNIIDTLKKILKF
jgi:hypothetical protein